MERWVNGVREYAVRYVAFIGEASSEKEYAVRYGLHLWKKGEASSEKSFKGE